MRYFWTALIGLTWSAISVSAIKISDSVKPFVPEVRQPVLDANCTGQSKCIERTAELQQSLSTTETYKLTAHDLDSLQNNGFAFLPGVLTNRKLLEELGKELTPLSYVPIEIMHRSMNYFAGARALVNDTNVRSIFDHFAKQQPGFALPARVIAPMVFHKSPGKHHTREELHFGKAAPWNNFDKCDFHTDSYPEDVTDASKDPMWLTLWIALSYTKEPLGIFRESHYKWGSVWGKCANDTSPGVDHRWCYDLQCVKDNLGDDKLWATDVAPGDMILFNARAIHGGIEQEMNRVALTVRGPYSSANPSSN
jgi:hypothetical protein